MPRGRPKKTMEQKLMDIASKLSKENSSVESKGVDYAQQRKLFEGTWEGKDIPEMLARMVEIESALPIREGEDFLSHLKRHSEFVMELIVISTALSKKGAVHLSKVSETLDSASNKLRSNAFNVKHALETYASRLADSKSDHSLSFASRNFILDVGDTGANDAPKFSDRDVQEIRESAFQAGYSKGLGMQELVAPGNHFDFLDLD